MKRKLILCFWTMVLVAMTAFAQDRTVRGVVISSEDNETVIGASIVVVEEPSIGVSTDILAFRCRPRQRNCAFRLSE